MAPADLVALVTAALAAWVRWDQGRGFKDNAAREEKFANAILQRLNAQDASLAKLEERTRLMLVREMTRRLHGTSEEEGSSGRSPAPR